MRQRQSTPQLISQQRELCSAFQLVHVCHGCVQKTARFVHVLIIDWGSVCVGIYDIILTVLKVPISSVFEHPEISPSYVSSG